MSSLTISQKTSSVSFQEPFTVPFADGVGLKLYNDCRPSCLETALLQKGFVLTLDRQELIGEGVGFGLPVVKYMDKTYFSGSANVSIQKTVDSYCLTKTYVLDTISKKLWLDYQINDAFYSAWRKRFANLYLSHKELLPLFNRAMELRDTAKVKTEFLRVKPKGKVKVTFRIKPQTLEVDADFSSLNKQGCEELLILNEQGASFFKEYRDSSGLRLIGGDIGGWAPVKVNFASLVNSRVSFKLRKIGGAKLFRGWENTKNRFSWAGLSYSLQPDCETFHYTIELSSNKTLDQA